MISRKQAALIDGRGLRSLRLAAGLLQSEVGRRAGISRGAVSKYETGRRRMSAEIRLRLFRALTGETNDPGAAK